MAAPTKRTLDLVWARDQSACILCLRPLQRGQGGYSVHHRRARGMGGSKDPVTDSPANLVLLCGSGTTGCHGKVESNREWALGCGLLVRQGRDPREVDLSLTFGPRMVRLSEDGRRAVIWNGSVIWSENPLVVRG